jgi:uncharacterized protein
MIVVSDTSAISGLIQIDRTELLELLYAKVVIPEAVRDELLQSHSLPAFIDVLQVLDREAVRRLESELDAGEAEAIVIAKEMKADLLLIDENLGRAVALREGLRIIGLLGVLAEAKARGFISSVRHEVGELESRAGFHVSTHVKEFVFREVGE